MTNLKGVFFPNQNTFFNALKLNFIFLNKHVTCFFFSHCQHFYTSAVTAQMCEILQQLPVLKTMQQKHHTAAVSQKYAP